MHGSISHEEQLSMRPAMPTDTALHTPAQASAMQPCPAPSILEMCDRINPGQMNYIKAQFRAYLSHVQYAQPLPKDASHHNLATRV